MKVTVTKLTDTALAQRACQFTLHSHSPTNIGLRKLYGSEHSPIRTQMFWIELKGIPTYVSVHLVRHKIGIEHYVSTNRMDRGADDIADRNSPVNHAMLCNAQALINMSRKRLCTKASIETRITMIDIKNAVRNVDEDLAEFMVADCVYRGMCYESSSCGIERSYHETS